MTKRERLENRVEHHVQAIECIQQKLARINLALLDMDRGDVDQRLEAGRLHAYLQSVLSNAMSVQLRR